MTNDDIARRAAEQIIRNCGDIKILTVPEFVDRVSPVIRGAIHEGIQNEIRRAEEARERADALSQLRGPQGDVRGGGP